MNAPDLSAQEGEVRGAATVTGVVRDAGTGEAVPDAEVQFHPAAGGMLVTVTGGDGGFRFAGVPRGGHRLVVQHLAYGEHEERLELEGPGNLHLDVTVSYSAIELSPLVVEARTDREMERRASGHVVNRVTRKEVEAELGRGSDLSDLLRKHVPGIRVRGGTSIGSPPCIEIRGAQRGGGECNSPAVYLDGVPLSAPTHFYSAIPLETVEHIQVLSPGEAGARFGMGSGGGALLIETQRPGFDPGAGDERRRAVRTAAVRFDWKVEPEPHDWLRVFAFSFAANAAGIYLGHRTAEKCFPGEGISAEGHFSRCGALGSMASGLTLLGLPPLSGGFAGRWAGSTALSRGDLLPSAMSAGVAMMPGAFLALSESPGSDGLSRPVGLFLLAVAPPIANTLADRIFRSFR